MKNNEKIKIDTLCMDRTTNQTYIRFATTKKIGQETSLRLGEQINRLLNL